MSKPKGGGNDPGGPYPWFLIDPPVGPYSPPEEIEEWIRYCEQMLERYPGHQQWEDTKREAEKNLRYALRIRP